MNFEDNVNEKSWLKVGQADEFLQTDAEHLEADKLT